ncbi:MAG TPA: hypothetical protein VH396_05895 [Chitinophagaceae bacterium]|jgi:hypothetical protein
MRTVLILVVLIASISVKAQTFFPGSFVDYTQRQAFVNDSAANNKWFLNKYGGISTGFSFFRGGNATTVAVPVGLQLNRRLNNNLYAFAGVSVAPAYVNFNHTFLSTDINRTSQKNTFLQSGSFNMYSRAELGLMYINDEKTFSISGSIGIERSTYPYAYPVFPYNQINNKTSGPVVSPTR